MVGYSFEKGGRKFEFVLGPNFRGVPDGSPVEDFLKADGVVGAKFLPPDIDGWDLKVDSVNILYWQFGRIDFSNEEVVLKCVLEDGEEAEELVDFETVEGLEGFTYIEEIK